MSQSSRSVKQNSLDVRYSNKDSQSIKSQQKSWLSSLQQLACVIPTNENRFHEFSMDDIEEEMDNFHLSKTSLRTSSSSSSRHERRQSISPYSNVSDLHESRHITSPFQHEIYKNEFFTPRLDELTDREQLLAYEENSKHISKKRVVTPEQHMDFIRNVFSEVMEPELPKDQKRREQLFRDSITRSAPSSYLNILRKENSIMVPLLDESFGVEPSPQAISLSMRRSNKDLYCFDSPIEIMDSRTLDNNRNEQQEKAVEVAIDSLNLTSKSSTTRDHESNEQMCDTSLFASIQYEESDEWKLLQEAKLEIASVKEFLRRQSISNDETEPLQSNSSIDFLQKEYGDVGIETLLLNNDRVAVIEVPVRSFAHNYKHGTRNLRRVSFGERPPLPPKSPQLIYSRNDPSNHLGKF